MGCSFEGAAKANVATGISALDFEVFPTLR